MNESVVNHVFLPHYLPSSSGEDFLSQNNRQHEYKLLECMKDYFNQFEPTSKTSASLIFSVLMNCLKDWCNLQNPQTFTVPNIRSVIDKLTPGSFLPIYFHAQNAAILIEMESDDVNQPLVSSWQVLLPTAKITSSLIPHLSCFPVTTYKLKDRSQLSSQAHCELLVDFMSNTIEYSQSLKAGRQVNEVRDVPTSHYVCRWWIQHFQDIKVYNDGDQPIQFKKKHRDQIRWNNAMTPFRRSGLWMTIKAVFQTILTKHLGPIGNIIYKLLITDFLTHVITKIHSEISTDVLVHCIRKTLRRVNKIETSLSSGDTGDWNKWIQHKKYTIQKTIQHIMPKSDWQDHIRISQKQSSNFLVDNFSLNDTDICKHSCSKLSSYLEALPTSRILSSSSNSNYRNELTDINLDDYIPSAQELRKRPNYTIGMVLTRIEIWIERDLERWMNRPSSGRNRFQALLFLFEDYQSDALSHYYPSSGSTDPIGYSRFILASLTIIRCMHEQLCKDPRFRRLEQHSIDIPNLMSLFQYLVLPNREDMTRARNLYDYFKMFLNKTYPDVLTRVDHTNAFGVYYASQSPEMNESIRKIRAQAEVDKKAKIQEVKDAKERYKRLMDSIQDVSCSCERVYGYRYHCITCSRCHTMNEANRIQVKIFESPLPSEDTDAYAVIFELQMPIEFRSYRDIVWQFINRPTPNRQHNMYEWLSVPPCNTKLAPYFTGPKDAKIKLISSRKSATQSHYSCPPSIATAPIETFLFECSLNVMISPTFPVEFDTECRILTPQLNHPDYKQLQFTIKNTGFLQNDVIAKLSQCPARLKPSQFVEFGSFRSGHLLQWWNLLALLEMDSLPISEESVAILVLHSILQYGPIAQDEHSSHRSWCSEAHQQLIEDNFTNELITRLDCRLDECERNWQNEMVLVVITVITMRILTICNSECEERTAALAIKCRKTSEKWIELISQSLQTMSSSDLNEMQILRSKMVTIGISCVLTFSTHANRIHLLLSSAEHGLSLLKAVTTIHDNIILSKDQSNITVFLSNMIRYSEHVLVTIQPRIAKLLREASFQLLNNFVSIHWAVIRKKGRMNANWQKRSTDVYDGWYDCDYESRSLSLNCVKGTFLVDGMTVGFLPENITNNSLFRRVFGNHIFEVQLAESSQTYITKHFYHGDRRVQYEFCWNDRTRQLTIIEQHTKTNKTFHMISPNLFDTELADRFVNDFSHWLIQERRTIEFRPLHFNHPDFLNYAPYELSLATGYIDTIGDIQPKKLVNQSSQLFQTLFSRYFVRLDDKPYVYMMYESDSQFNRVFHIYLTRLGIAFKYDAATKILTSREYADMYVDQDQWLGTLTGLQSGLLLSPLPGDHYCLEHYPYKKLIVSFGTVKSNWNSSEHHQTVKIDRSGSISHPNKYFTFLLNDRLKVLQSTDSPTGWLYLALLHALTSHALPDEYTGMTGMERAFQLLYSAGCQSDQPYDDLSLEIICTIASISPKVDYYPQHLTCMVKIDWNENTLPYSSQHFGYYLIAKDLIENSRLFNFMYSSLTASGMPELFQARTRNENLLRKLYFDYRDSYNPAARLSAEMETHLLSSKQGALFFPDSGSHSHICNYPVLRLADDLYEAGDVYLQNFSATQWLPLTNWLNGTMTLRNFWVGLLKFVHYLTTTAAQTNTDDKKRFEILLDFLYYISDTCRIEPFYLQMLKTALTKSNTCLREIAFPSFTSYEKIEETSFIKDRMLLEWTHSTEEKCTILREVEDCWQRNFTFTNACKLASTSEVSSINRLFESWRSNKILREFLEDVQKRICSVPIEGFDAKISFNPQKFVFEAIEDHYQIRIFTRDDLINRALLQIAENKFHQRNSDYFDKEVVHTRNNNQQREFPMGIFPSNDNQVNPLREITNYFKKQLSESWDDLLKEIEVEKKPPTIEEVQQYLNLLRKETHNLWAELSGSFRESNEQLFEIGLLCRITPTTLVSLLLRNHPYSEKAFVVKLTTVQCTILGGIVVNWTLEQQLERALHFAIHDKSDEYKKEMSHTPHANWKPSEHIHWVILELEMNITIREIQVQVAQHMIKPMATQESPSVQNIVMQMNMGEGKTSVILPMLAVELSSADSVLTRIIVLKSLFPTNYDSLKYKLGGLLNRRIFSFRCRRDLNFNNQQINKINHRLQRGLHRCDVLLTSPEDILSFDLLTIDRCRKEQFEIGRSMLNVQRWLKTYARDVLDESDEILHVKYQLIYTIGGQQQVDGGAERWKTIQTIFILLKKHCQDIFTQFQEKVFYKPPARKSAFPQFRLQSHEPYAYLCTKISKDWIDSRNYRHEDKNMILSFIRDTLLTSAQLDGKFPSLDIQLFLMVRGLLTSEVLLVALRKRHRVNYGVNPSLAFNRLMAVPFRAKDVVADRTEFGHPDVALVLSHLSYYYSGLSNSQLSQCFKRLSESEIDPVPIYDQWVLYEDNVPNWLKQWKGVNLKDCQQCRAHLFPTFRHNMLVINYFLNHFVFPREAKQFPQKLVASSWDLSSSLRSQLITGFSGTNDTQLLLPVHIRQHDLPELKKTDAIVISNLLQPDNAKYQFLTIDATSESILKEIIKCEEPVNVILDVGALFIDESNRDIALQWLKLSSRDKIDYAVYFDNDTIFVCDRQYHHHPFAMSPASERLDHCVFYLDEIHTRGTDFKFPIGFKAAVTLGVNLTKDRFVQACMRMRKLGHGHSLMFWSSCEVHQQIEALKKKSQNVGYKKIKTNQMICLYDILHWVYKNTQKATWDGLHYWATQSLSYQRKISAYHNVQWTNHQQQFTDVIMKQLATECVEPEMLELMRMYGCSKTLKTLFEIHQHRYQQTCHDLCNDIRDAVLYRLQDYGGAKQRLSQLLDEEQQRELEQELEEERQLEPPPPVDPCTPKLHPEIKRLCGMQNIQMDLQQYPHVFQPLPYAYVGTTFLSDCQFNSWEKNMWISTEFQRVVETKGDSLNPFLRPPRWIIVYRNQELVVLSPLEANWIMGRLNSLYREGQLDNASNTTLRLLLPRVKRNQSILINTPTLSVPPLIGCPMRIITSITSLDFLAQLFIFNGSLYFESIDEQTIYCQLLSLCPNPRTQHEEKAFERGWIGTDGFVSEDTHRTVLQMGKVRFRQNLLNFVKQIIEMRNHTQVPLSSHVGSILLDARKML